MKNRKPIAFRSARPLVRYVDEDQAVIDTIVSVVTTKKDQDAPVDVHIRMTGPRGRVITVQKGVTLRDGAAMIRFEIGDPRRWWPAGMGDQELYEFCITLLAGDEAMDSWQTTLGLTSVRSPEGQSEGALLVNGREYSFQSIVAVDPDDERSVLPASSDSLLLVRDHFGPDILYDAADRAGILLIQSVPLKPRNDADFVVNREVDRLAAHPSLAGWLVGDETRFSDRIAHRLHHLDPTRYIFRTLPMAS
ncbi:MAG: hypothetical protein CMJ18_11355 [Phycisphaeraceae bacterium]|nr:hypothetical protein [Phycisphaeraceae bacterium]